MTEPGPAWLYLHGFASSPESSKGRAFKAWGASRDVAVETLDLRVPSLAHLRFSAIKSRVRDAIDRSAGTAPVAHARAVLIGSSLGGLAACRVAEDDSRVCAVLAMAPAFGIADGWRSRLGERAWEAWRRDGSLEIDDYATNQKARLDFGFIEELAHLDAGWPDVRVPVLIVHGTDDTVVDVDRSRKWAVGKRHVRLVEVPDAHELSASIAFILAEASAFFAPFLGAETIP